MFSADELRRFLRYRYGDEVTPSLPGPTSSPAHLVETACDVLERHSLVDRAFFAALRDERPRRGAEIDAVMKLWDEPQEAVKPFTWSSPEQLAKIQLEALPTHRDRTISARFLVRGAAAARSVAKVLVHRHFGDKPRFLSDESPECASGTGWLIAPTLFITNHHVIAARHDGDPPVAPGDFDRQARSTTLHFDYLAADAQFEPVRAIESVAADPDLDFALLRLPPGDRPPLRLRKRLLERSRDTPLSECVNVLQHPNGEPMRIGLRNNFVVHGDATWLSYLTDTRHGASGSPVCDDDWGVVALHRGHRELTGVSIKLDNVAVRTENYGVQLPAVLEWLRQHAPAVQREIEAAQARL
ncbi:Trypsin-like peptidase domain-containing protein [Nannocystis exedens]|uniref:Trypsin-like peptidase domain-containing protein n=1 Tax=Nannocystis exedens TaxID=54 RepID=A0A1I1ZSS1_9BACT|nr:serine protease [Nannocystis exedens]PCC75331.1 serine protease [Nannocystis exedens]SFE34749.1 Trypsin-like peptidase domain-containing protein [Nannocystis exedens]